MVASAHSPMAAVARMPHHVAVIMDGNGRWAEQRGLPRKAGHRRGVESVRSAVERCAELGVGHLTLFAFSSENWNRPKEEICGLMSLFIEALNRELAELNKQNVRLRFMGETRRLDPELRCLMRSAERQTDGNTRLDLSVAVAYGGRGDLVNAARRLARQAATGTLDPDQIDEERYASELEMARLPDVDLLIRTGGDRRISNFLLWSLAYSELYFTDVLWPDFRSDDLNRAVDFYSNRQRKFGRTAQQIEASVC